MVPSGSQVVSSLSPTGNQETFHGPKSYFSICSEKKIPNRNPRKEWFVFCLYVEEMSIQKQEADGGIQGNQKMMSAGAQLVFSISFSLMSQPGKVLTADSVNFLTSSNLI